MGWDVSYSTAEECVSVCVSVWDTHIRLSSDTGVGHCGDVLGGVGVYYILHELSLHAQ